jgi:beta-phosphoglucomutase family hydrolase
MMRKAKAFIFDLNGTMVDDMRYHARAWYHIVNNTLHGRLSLEEVEEQMYGKNEEVIERIFGKGRFTGDQMRRLSIEKEKIYQKEYAPHLGLIKGLENFLRQAEQHDILLALGTAAIPFNINFVLDTLGIRHYFSVIVSADDVKTSKPNPETFLKAATLLGVRPMDCIVFEDAPKGVEAAYNAGMRSIVVLTMHKAAEFKEYGNVDAFITDYADESLQKLFNHS